MMHNPQYLILRLLQNVLVYVQSNTSKSNSEELKKNNNKALLIDVIAQI